MKLSFNMQVTVTIDARGAEILNELEKEIERRAIRAEQPYERKFWEADMEYTTNLYRIAAIFGEHLTPGTCPINATFTVDKRELARWT